MAAELRQRPARMRADGPAEAVSPPKPEAPAKKSGGCPVQIKSGEILIIVYAWVRRAIDVRAVLSYE